MITADIESPKCVQLFLIYQLQYYAAISRLYTHCSTMQPLVGYINDTVLCIIGDIFLRLYYYASFVGYIHNCTTMHHLQVIYTTVLLCIISHLFLTLFEQHMMNAFPTCQILYQCFSHDHLFSSESFTQSTYISVIVTIFRNTLQKGHFLLRNFVFFDEKLAVL